MAIVNEIALLLVLVYLVQGQLECDRVITVNSAADNDTQGCINGDYPCSSLYYALSNIQSNDCVNITSDSVSLSKVAELNNISTITIRGNGSTIVMCNNTGGLSCNNCSDVVIEGITWNRCTCARGDPQKHNQSKIYIAGGIQFSKIFNLKINNCSFQYSKVRALSLLDVSGTVVVNASNFFIQC